MKALQIRFPSTRPSTFALCRTTSVGLSGSPAESHTHSARTTLLYRRFSATDSLRGRAHTTAISAASIHRTLTGRMTTRQLSTPKVRFFCLFFMRSLARLSWSVTTSEPFAMRPNETPNHALQRTAAGYRGCKRRVPWPPSLSLGRSLR